MRAIGTLSNESHAQIFGDFLYARGIENAVEPEGNSTWTVWVQDEDDLETARELLEQFRQNPTHPKFQEEAGKARLLKEEKERDDVEFQKRYHERDEILPASRPYGIGPLTIGLIAVCVYFSVQTKLGADENILRLLYISKYTPNHPLLGWLPEVRNGEVWRLLTPVFLHFGIWHIFFNMMWLFHLGSMIEARSGSLLLALQVIGIGLLSNVAQYFMGVSYFGGMSGVVYGLFGYVWVRSKLQPSSGYFMDRTNLILMIVWLFLCMTGAVGRVANTAHVSGLLIGMAWGFLASKINPK